MGTGASRMMQPLPAAPGLTDPEKGSPVRSNFRRAEAVVLPMSKHRPLLLM